MGSRWQAAGYLKSWFRTLQTKKYEHIPKRTDIFLKKAVWFCNVMRYGLLSDKNIIKYGYGLRLTGIRGKFPEHIQERQGRCARPLEFTSRIMQWECIILYWLLVSIPSSRQTFFRQEWQRKDKSYRTFQPYFTAARFTSGKKTLSFSKKMKNHIGHFWILFIITMKIYLQI
jgi:hypothetical protein